jgi:hypothetical protein
MDTWRFRVAEVDRCDDRGGDPKVLSHLGALVPGDRPSQSWRQLTEALTERVAVALGQAQQPDETGLALDERADRGLLVFADDQVTLPASRFAAVLGLIALTETPQVCSSKILTCEAGST